MKHDKKHADQKLAESYIWKVHNLTSTLVYIQFFFDIIMYTCTRKHTDAHTRTRWVSMFYGHIQ